MCVRPQTYESAEEAEILSYVFAGRSGLQNTSFALLDPKGKKLTRGSRSPRMTYGTVERFAQDLEKVAAAYEKKAKSIEALPQLRDLRIALNVAAADMRPLVVVVGTDEAGARKLEQAVATASWGADLVGTCHYVVLAEEETYEGLTPKLGVTVVQPDPYGLGGSVLAHAKPDVSAKSLAKMLAKGLEAHEAEDRDHSDHVREARRRQILWEPAIPVSDAGGSRRSRR